MVKAAVCQRRHVVRRCLRGVVPLVLAVGLRSAAVFVRMLPKQTAPSFLGCRRASFRGYGKGLARNVAQTDREALQSLDDDGGTVDEEKAEIIATTVRRWLDFLSEVDGDGAKEVLADHSGFPLEHALELLRPSRSGGSKLLTQSLPEGTSQALGPVGWIMAVRAGEDLDLSLLGGEEWNTLHLDVLAANPLISWASEAAFEGRQLLFRLLASAAKAGRAVTVAPLSEQVKEQFRKLGFQEDSLLDPTLMFWVPNEEGLMFLPHEQVKLACRGS